MNNYMLERKGLNHRDDEEQWRRALNEANRDTALLAVAFERLRPAARSAYYLLKGQQQVLHEANQPSRAVDATLAQLAAALGVEDAE